MIFEEDKLAEKIGKSLGYLLSYSLFTTILYLILMFLKKDDSSYFFVMGITLGIAIIGLVLKRMLK